MGLSRAWRHAKVSMRIVAVAIVLVGNLLLTLTPAYAGTTGLLHGVITNSVSNEPVADVAVTATAPTGTYKAVTDAKGFYSIAGVYADTYTVSFAKAGFQPQSVTGVTVFADQSQTLNLAMTKSLTTIAKVVATSQGSAFKPRQTTDTYTVTQTQIANLQGSSLNLSESNLLTSLPGVGYDSSGYPVIHGGRENEEGFEFEGIPYTDAFTNQFVNTLSLPGTGISSAQLTPGVGDASVQSNGTGVINLVAQRGTYPGFSNLEFRVGGPGFSHAFNGAISTASANGHISEYAAFAGAQTSPQFGDSKYPANLTGTDTQTLLETDREFLNNLIFRFGKNNNQSVQLFADIAQHNFFQSYGGLNGWCFASCNPFFTSFYGSVYGLTNTQLGNLSGLYPGQAYEAQTLASAANRAPNTYYQPNETYKVAYTLSINPSTYLSMDAYSVNSVSTFDFPTGGQNILGVGDINLLQGGHRLGGEIKLQKQLNEKNLIEAGYAYNWLHPVYQFNSQGYAFYADIISSNALAPYDFISPTDPNCPLGPGGCGYAYQAFGANPPAQLQLPLFSQLSDMNRQDQSFYLTDKIDVNNNLTAHVGFRVENSRYIGFPTPQLLSNCTFLYNPASAPANPNYNPANPAVTGNCPYTPNFSNITSGMTKPSVFEPRLGISLRVAPHTALRATYERAASMPILSFVDAVVNQGAYSPYAGLASNIAGPACGIAPYLVPCANYAQQTYWAYQNFNGVPYQPILPMTSNNYEVTLEHQFTKGALNGVAVSISPWTRHQYNTTASVSQPLLNASGQPLVFGGVVQTGPATQTNLGKEYANGVDVQITKDARYGLSGQLAMSYINEFSSVIPTSPSEDFFPSIPYSSVAAGDVYRVGFVSPFQATLGLTYKTKKGWSFNPRLQFDDGYPIGNGTLTANFVNGVAINVPNTDVLTGSAANSSGIGPVYYVDPLNPGSVLKPNIIANRGNAETSSAGGKLTKPDLFANFTVSYTPPHANYTIGFDVENLFDRIYGGSLNPSFNNRYQPVATGISGPLTGYSVIPAAYTTPYANPQYLSAFGGNSVFTNFPNQQGRSFYFYLSTKV